jgi:hypothetical protein
LGYAGCGIPGIPEAGMHGGLEQTEEFEFETCYRSGQLNQHADALSRRPQQQKVAALSHSIRFSAEDIKNKQMQDPILSQVTKHLRLGEGTNQPSDPKVRRWLKKRDSLFFDKEGILYMSFRQGRIIFNQLIVPDTLVSDVLQMKHDEAGHMSSSKTRKLIQREYYWSSVSEDTKRYCQREYTADATITSQPTEPWQEISMDLKGPIGPRYTSRRNHYLLVVLDLFTRAAEVIPIPNMQDSKDRSQRGSYRSLLPTRNSGMYFNRQGFGAR